MMDTVINLKLENLHSHPDNPRKDIGDIEEMTKSVKKNGIMQNLTVMPISALELPEEKQPLASEISVLSDFVVLIGHRRMAAAKAAGLEKVPCKIISQISKKEQVAIMLEENMQRNDLTVYEQAQGFQMMLDLGETAEMIAEKTGFSQATVYHRLNIAKLDQEELKKKTNRDNMQLSLKDLSLLEQVKNVKTRNKILKESNDSRDLICRVRTEVENQKKRENEKKIVRLMKDKGIKPAPEKAENERYNGNWDVLKEYNLLKDAPKSIRVAEPDNVFYVNYWGNTIAIIKKAKKQKKELSEFELEQKERDKKKKEIKQLTKMLMSECREFIISIVNGTIPAIKNEIQMQERIMRLIVKNDYYTNISFGPFLAFFTGKNTYDTTDEEKQSVRKQLESISMTNIFLILLYKNMDGVGEYNDWQGHWNSNKTIPVREGFEVLKEYGWSFSREEYEKLLDGSSDLYEKENADADKG